MRKQGLRLNLEKLQHLLVGEDELGDEKGSGWRYGHKANKQEVFT